MKVYVGPRRHQLCIQLVGCLQDSVPSTLDGWLILRGGGGRGSPAGLARPRLDPRCGMCMSQSHGAQEQVNSETPTMIEATLPIELFNKVKAKCRAFNKVAHLGRI